MAVHVEDFRVPDSYDTSQALIDAGALLDAQSIGVWADSLFGRLQDDRLRLANIDRWLDGSQEPYHIPPSKSQKKTAELQSLLDLSRSPLLSLIPTTIAQSMYVDGYKSPTTGETVAGPWLTWNANRMPAKQIPLHRAMITYGYNYVLLEKGVTQDGQPRTVWKVLTPHNVHCVYADPANDEWPAIAFVAGAAVKDGFLATLYDSVMRHDLRRDDTVGRWLVMSSAPHGCGNVPLVRYNDQLDVFGNPKGQVEPLIGLAKRIDKTMFDRLLVQHYNSWKKMYVSGLTNIETEDEATQAKLRLRHDDALVFEDPETKVGVVPETSLDGFLSAIQADISALANAAQLPPNLFSLMPNLSADAIAAYQRPLVQKIYERQITAGESHAQAMRFSAHLEGDVESASDVLAHVTWQDMEIRSLAQAADALGKMATQLGIPRKALWRMIPGKTSLDVQEWEDMVDDDDAVSKYLRSLDKVNSGKVPGVSGADPSVPVKGIDNQLK